MGRRSTTADRIISAMVHKARGGRAGMTEGWQDRHLSAWIAPADGGEAAIKSAIIGLAGFADDWNLGEVTEDYDGVCTDGYCGPYFEQMAGAIIGLLSMDIGRFDAGTLDGLIRDIVRNEGGELQ